MTGLGVYIHWPYCKRICPYCDFNVYKEKAIDVDAWQSAFETELAYWADHLHARPVRSIYFGGGTPSLMPPSLIGHVLEVCHDLFGFEPNIEITLEANPSSVEAAKFGSFQHAGINRLSLGVQSLDDDALAFLGRDHSAKEARTALTAALARFRKSSFDLIYARPDQSIDAWQKELADALAFDPKHLSLYQLTIEPGTAFEKSVLRKDWTMPEDGLAADLFDLTQEMTAQAGLPAYEISNHAANGAKSKHNLLYWHQDDYLGIGPGAHGRVTLDGQRFATETQLIPADYLSAVRQHHVGGTRSRLGGEEMIIEQLAMGLRLTDGCPLTANTKEWLAERTAIVNELAEEGFLVRSDNRLTATKKGRRVLNSVLSLLLT